LFNQQIIFIRISPKIGINSVLWISILLNPFQLISFYLIATKAQRHEEYTKHLLPANTKVVDLVPWCLGGRKFVSGIFGSLKFIRILKREYFVRGYNFL
jgi:hypothetical protein